MARSYDHRSYPQGPGIQPGPPDDSGSGKKKTALRGRKRLGPIGAIVPGDDVEVARELARLRKPRRKRRGGAAAVVALTALPFHHVSLGTSSDKAVAINEAAVLTGYYFSNSHPSLLRYLKLYDQTSAPSPVSDDPELNLPMPPLAGATVGLDSPIPFAAGIAFAIRAGVAITDDTNVGADEVVINLFYRLGTE